MQDSFDLARVEAGVAGTPFAHRVYHLVKVSSTNTVALDAAQAGVAAGVWVADEQTAGRGRSGHQWHSVVGDGLYVSVLLRPQLVGAEALKLSLAAGLAAQRAVLEVAGIETDLRWPNDLMVTGLDGLERKFGGILTESAMEGREGRLAYAVIGMGLNLNHAGLPDELQQIATSLRMIGGQRISREALLVALLRGLAEEIARVEAEAGGAVREHITERFARASSWVKGLRVEVAEDAGYTGTTDGLDRHGLLRVRLDDGTIRTVRHGGVRRLAQGLGLS